MIKSLRSGEIIIEQNESRSQLISVFATTKMFRMKIADTLAAAVYNHINFCSVVASYYCFDRLGYPWYVTEILLSIVHTLSYWHEIAPNLFYTIILSDIRSELMEKIFSHDEFSAKSEATVYQIIKAWLQLKGALETENLTESFLNSKEGKNYERILALLPLEYLVMDKTVEEMLRIDKIYPTENIEEAITRNQLIATEYDGCQHSKSAIKDGCRVALFKHHSNKAELNFYGIVLKFAYESNRVTVERKICEDSIFNGKAVTLQFQIAFHNPKWLYEGDRLEWFDHKIQEQQTVVLVEQPYYTFHQKRVSGSNIFAHFVDKILYFRFESYPEIVSIKTRLKDYY